MFVINQLLGTLLVHPDWDASLQIGLRYVTLGISVYVVDCITDVSLAVSTFEGMYG